MQHSMRRCTTPTFCVSTPTSSFQWPLTPPPVLMGGGTPIRFDQEEDMPAPSYPICSGGLTHHQMEKWPMWPNLDVQATPGLAGIHHTGTPRARSESSEIEGDNWAYQIVQGESQAPGVVFRWSAKQYFLTYSQVSNISILGSPIKANGKSCKRLVTFLLRRSRTSSPTAGHIPRHGKRSKSTTGMEGDTGTLSSYSGTNSRAGTPPCSTSRGSTPIFKCE